MSQERISKEHNFQGLIFGSFLGRGGPPALDPSFVDSPCQGGCLVSLLFAGCPLNLKEAIVHMGFRQLIKCDLSRIFTSETQGTCTMDIVFVKGLAHDLLQWALCL